MKLDTNKIAMTACNALVSAVCGGLGTYAVHRITKKADQITGKVEKENRRKIGFDMRAVNEMEETL